MSENREVLVSQLLSEDEVNLQSIYILKYLHRHLTDIKIKSGARIFRSDIISSILDASFIEQNLNTDFKIGKYAFTADRSENANYMELGFTRFSEDMPDIVSEGIRIRLKRASNIDSIIEYHKKTKDENTSEIYTNTKTAVEKAIDFISSIS